MSALSFARLPSDAATRLKINILIMAMVDVDSSSRLSADSHPNLSPLGLRIGCHPALSLHSSNEPGELSQWL